MQTHHPKIMTGFRGVKDMTLGMLFQRTRGGQETAKGKLVAIRRSHKKPASTPRQETSLQALPWLVKCTLTLVKETD